MGQPRVLVVEVDRASRDLLGDYFDAEGYAVRPAADGAEALDLLDGWRPDLIILDLMMPGIDGAEVLRRIREDPQTRAVPVTVFSAVADPAVRDHLLGKGAQDYWLKASFDFGQLNGRVNRLLVGGSFET